MTSGIDRRSFLAGWPGLFRRGPLRDYCGVQFYETRRGSGAAARYLVIHGDEGTARDVLMAHMKTVTGTALMVTGNTRHVQVRGLTLDPNRMYSKAGADASLRSLNPHIPDVRINEVSAWLDHHREKLLRTLTPARGSRLFALHNNQNYSINDELAASDETSVKQPSLPTHFFLCTAPADFAILKQSPYNVVLQTRAEPDDGSMSRLAARRGFRYINLEVKLGDFEGQMERVKWLETHLP